MPSTIDLMVWPFAFLAKLWWLVTRYSSVAILISAASAGVFATLTMRRNSQTARVKEIFTTINHDNWDEDVIEARQGLRRILNTLKLEGAAISKYAAEEYKLALEIDPLTDKKNVEPINPPQIMPTGQALSPADKFIKDKITLLSIMNNYENLALGVKHGILDEYFLFQYMRATLLLDWNALSPLVYE